MNLNRDIAIRVGVLLESQRKTRAALAQAMGIGASALDRRMKGAKAWTVDDVVSAAQFLDTDPRVLFGAALRHEAAA